MDYVVGSIADLISGNVTPNRPKISKRALTPTKHMPSPNVTPKSEFATDRSIFLSPTMQKKKAIVKKSPKRIFQNPDLDVTNENDGNFNTTSPKADKVKKHLKNELESTSLNKSTEATKSPIKKGKSAESSRDNVTDDDLNSSSKENLSANELTPKKKKKQRKSASEVYEEVTKPLETISNEGTPTKNKKRKANSISEDIQGETKVVEAVVNGDVNASMGSPTKKKKQKNISISENIQNETKVEVATVAETNSSVQSLKKKKKIKNKSISEKSQNNTKAEAATVNAEANSSVQSPKNKKKKNKNKSISENSQNKTKPEAVIVNAETNSNAGSSKKKKNKNKAQTAAITKNVSDQKVTENSETKEKSSKKKNRKRKKSKLAAEDNLLTEETKKDGEEHQPTKRKKIKVNPNAVTDKDSDSEHESDNEIESENEEANKEVLENDVAEDSSDEEEAPKTKKKEKKEKIEKPETEKDNVREINTEEEVKRTLFVGNVPFSAKCKKEIKKIFNKYGEIQSVRIRTVPVKNPSVSPKVAVITEELHPERSTVNVYVKFADPESVDAALAENNTVLNDNHLRVSRSGNTGAEHDPRRSIFVGNVPFGLEDEGLREKFQGCGEIASVRIVRDKKTNAGKGFGYVNFVSKDGVELALALTEEDLTIKNRIMRVKRCTLATQRQSQRKFQGPKKNFQPHKDFQPRQGFKGKKVSQGDRQRNMQGQRVFQKGGSFQSRGNFGREDGQKDGAYRRVMNKRKSQESGDGPPPKKTRDGAPREKKPRKEFVGVTAEKKKKHKFDKGQKKKKALSEILTKYNK